MKIQPFDDLILVRPYEVGGTDSRLVLSQKAKSELMPYVMAEVVAVGPGRELECGRRREMNVAPKDKVMFSVNAPIFPIDKKIPLVGLNGEEMPSMCLINIGHLLGVVETDVALKYAEETPVIED